MKKRAAFDAVCRLHYSRLSTLALRLTGDRDEAEDLLQEALLNAWRGWCDFRGECAPSTWLYRILVNTARKQLRGARPLPVSRFAAEHNITEEAVYAQVNRSAPVEDGVLLKLTKERCLQSFMECLAPGLRAVFTLRSILHCTVHETAQILNCKPGTVKVNHHRARNFIREHMEQRCSLIRSGAPCRCATFAGHILTNAGGLENERLVQIGRVEIEPLSVQRFHREMHEITRQGETERLFQTGCTLQARRRFLQRLTALKNENRLKVLGGTAEEQTGPAKTGYSSSTGPEPICSFPV